MGKILSDFHVHTNFCDGQNSPEEIVLAAISAGMETIGFSGHSHTPFDESYAMSHETTRLYCETVNSLKKKYSGKIKIYCGIERDRYSDLNSAHLFDYVIGSVHYICKSGEYFPVDETAEILSHAAEKFYDGDIYALIDDYYDTVSSVTNTDVCGHFDLITKFIERETLFDTQDPRYVSAYRRALDKLILKNKNIIFEINTGAMSRGYRSEPYPSRQILRDIKSLGGSVAISSDSHSCQTLMFAFDKALDIARECGFTEISVLNDGAFQSREI